MISDKTLHHLSEVLLYSESIKRITEETPMVEKIITNSRGTDNGN
jgi:hypothetical protein